MYKIIAGILLVILAGIGVHGALQERALRTVQADVLQSYVSRKQVSENASCVATATMPLFHTDTLDAPVFAAFKEALGGFYLSAESDEEIPNAPTTIQAALDTWTGFCEQELKQQQNFEGDSATQHHTVDVRGEVATHTSDLLSVVLRTSTYTGGAHPNALTETVNIHPGTGVTVDLVTESVLQSMAKQVLAQKGDVLFDADRDALSAFVQTGERRDAIRANYAKHWYVKHGNVVIVFDPYTAAPYAAGTFEIVVDSQ